jgi:hypothetical protein
MKLLARTLAFAAPASAILYIWLDLARAAPPKQVAPPLQSSFALGKPRPGGARATEQKHAVPTKSILRNDPAGSFEQRDDTLTGLGPAQPVLFDFFYSHPEFSLLEVSSLVCRERRCELKLLSYLEPEPSTRRAWEEAQGAQMLYRWYQDSALAQTLLLDGLTANYMDDRVMYTLTFKRVSVD